MRERLIGPQDSAQRIPGRILRRRAQSVIDHPAEWVLGATLIWRNKRGERVTDQMVDAARKGRRS